MELLLISVSLFVISLVIGYVFGHWRGYLVGRAEMYLMRTDPPDKNEGKEVI